jgi:hypothetical protein
MSTRRGVNRHSRAMPSAAVRAAAKSSSWIAIMKGRSSVGCSSTWPRSNKLSTCSTLWTPKRRSGQGGAQKAAGLGVPFLISGPWTKPSYKPDMKAVAGMLLDQATKGSGGPGWIVGRRPGRQKIRRCRAKKPGLDLNRLFGR